MVTSHLVGWEITATEVLIYEWNCKLTYSWRGRGEGGREREDEGRVGGGRGEKGEGG